MELKFNFIELWLNSVEKNDNDLAQIIAKERAGNVLLEYLIRKYHDKNYCRR